MIRQTKRLLLLNGKENPDLNICKEPHHNNIAIGGINIASQPRHKFLAEK